MYVRLCAAHAVLTIPDCRMQQSACRMQAAGSVRAGTDLHAGCASMTPLPVCAVPHACTCRIGIVQHMLPARRLHATSVLTPRSAELPASDPETAGCYGTWMLAEQPMPPLAYDQSRSNIAHVLIIYGTCAAGGAGDQVTNR